MLAGSELRLSTEFTRQSDFLPGNTAGDSLCSFNASYSDICHVYINPDRNNVSSNIILSVHFMESGRHIDSKSDVVFTNVSFEYKPISNIGDY